MDYMNEAFYNYRQKKQRVILGVQFHKPLGCMSGYSHPPTGSHQTHNNAPKSNKTRDDTKSVTISELNTTHGSICTN